MAENFEDFSGFGTRLDLSGQGERIEDQFDFSQGGTLLDFSDEGEAVESPEKPLSFTESFGRGIDVGQSLLGGAVEATGEAFGAEGLTSFGRRMRERNIQEAQAYGQRTGFKDIDSPGRFGQWAKETIGEQIPLMAPSLAGGVAGAAIGSVVPVVGTALGAAIGALVPSLVLGVGEVQSGIKEKDPLAKSPGLAFAGGSAIAALDSVLPGKVGGHLVRVFGREAGEEIAKKTLEKPVKQEWITRTSSGFASGMATEGVTEAMQEAIGEVASSQAAGQKIDWDALGSQMIEAGAAGALLGGSAGGITSAFTRPGVREQSIAATPPPTQEDIDSPIPTGTTQRGKEILQELIGENSASEILEQAGFPSVGSPVTLTAPGGTVSGTVIDAVDDGGWRGAKIRLDDGRVLTETFESLGRIVQTEVNQNVAPAPIENQIPDDIIQQSLPSRASGLKPLADQPEGTVSADTVTAPPVAQEGRVRPAIQEPEIMQSQEAARTGEEGAAAEPTKIIPPLGDMVTEAARWKGAALKVAKTLEGDKRAALKHSKATTKGDLDAYLMRKFGVDESTARDVSNELTRRNMPADMSADVDDFSGEPWAKPTAQITSDKAPARPELPAEISVPFGSIKTNRIGGPLYRETNLSGLDDLIRNGYTEGAPSPTKQFVTDNIDLALGQGENKGVLVQFRGEAVSGQEHKKPGTGELTGREYQTDVVGLDAINQIIIPKNAKLRGLTKTLLNRNFDREILSDGRMLFSRKGVDVGERLDKLRDLPASEPIEGIDSSTKIYRGSGGRPAEELMHQGIPIAGEATYWSLDRRDAERYGANIEERSFDLKNPLVIREDIDWSRLTYNAGWDVDNLFGKPKDEISKKTNDLRNHVVSQGYDGIVVLFDNSSPNDREEKTGNIIKLLRNVFGVPQVIDYREKPKTEKTTKKAESRDERQRNIYNRRIQDIQDVAELKAYAEDLRTALLTDERTGLGSNRAWINRTPKTYIASIDLDSLKWVNDNMGHDAGDRMIEAVGEAFQRTDLAEDAYHVSGDEFYVQADKEDQIHEAMRIAKEYLAGVEIKGGELSYKGPGFSYGIGKTIKKAEMKLHEDKTGREKSGERSGRGERPKGVVDAAQTPKQKPAAGDTKKATKTREGERAERSKPVVTDITGTYKHSKIQGAEATVTKTDKGYRVEWSEDDVQEFRGVAAADKVIKAMEDEGYKKSSEAEDVRSALPSIETPAFKKWFGNSKVVDDKGNPKVVYHGTAQGGFSEFDTYASNYGLMGMGGYFTEDPAVATEYTEKGVAKIKKRGEDPRQAIYPVYLSIRKPIDMDAKADLNAWSKAFSNYVSLEDFDANATNEDALRTVEDVLTGEMLPLYEGAEIVQEGIRSMGFDGITHIGGGRVDKDSVRHRVWIAFDPEQIKSATGNRGTFDPSDPDILFDLSDTESFIDSIDQLEGLTDSEIALAEELLDNGAKISNKGNVRVYHRTSAQNAKSIKSSGKMKGLEDGLFFTTSPIGTQSEGYGKAVVEMDIPLSKLQLDDVFGDEAHVRIPAKKAGAEVDVSAWIVLKEGFDGAQFDLSDKAASKPELIQFDLTESMQAKYKDVAKELLKRLKELGVGDKISLRLRDRMELWFENKIKQVKGFHNKGLIEIALSGPDPMGTLNHEIIHALRELGLFTEAEWKALENKAKSDSTLMRAMRERYKPLNLSEESIIEEAIANMSTSFFNKKLEAKGFVRTALRKIGKFFEALRNSLRGNGFITADDVFVRVGRGEVGRRAGRAGKDRGERFELGDKILPERRKPTPNFDNPESEARWQEARKGIAGHQTLISRLSERLEYLKQGFTRHFINLPEEPFFSDAREQMRKLEAAPQAAKEQAIRNLKAITNGMNREDLDLFTRKVVLDDLSWEADVEHELPFGFTPRDVARERVKIDAALRNRPDLMNRIRLRNKMSRELADNLVSSGVLSQEQIRNPAYYRHQVLDYARAQVAYAKGPGKKLKTPKWARRMGSKLDINANLLEAEFEWMQKAIMDISSAKTIDWFKKSMYNVRDDVIGKAKAHNKKLVEKNIEKDLKDNGFTKTSGKITSPINEEWLGFRQRIAMGLGKIRQAIEDGELTDIPAEHAVVAKSLTDSEISETSIFPFLAWILDNNLPGSMGAAQAFKAISQRKVWTQSLLGDQYADTSRVDSLVKRFAPEGYKTWQPDEGKLLFTAKTIPEHVLDRMLNKIAEEGAGGVMTMEELKGALDSVKSMLAVGGPKYQMILPEEIADSLNSIRDDIAEGLFDTLLTVPLTWWKRWILINPRRVLKYNLNNISGDLDAVVAGNPKVIKKLPQAIKELYQVMTKGEAPSQRYIDAVDRGVFDSGLSAQEIPDINYLTEFEKIINPPTIREPIRLTLSPLVKVWRKLQQYTTFRENWMRYAAYLDYIDRIEAGESLESIGYGASRKEMVDAILDQKDKAALLARDLVGDYGAISHFGKGIRQKLIPFYSWMEINTKRYWRLGANAWSQGVGQGFRTTGIIGASLGLRTTAYLTLRMAMLYGLVQLWNNLVFGDEEDELNAEDRARLHLILGRDDAGEIRTLRFQGALSDYLGWIGFADAVGVMSEIEKGRADYVELAETIGKAPVNKVLTSVTPLISAPVESLSGYKYWPDVFQPRAIKDKWRNAAQLFSVEHEYDLIFERPSRGYGRSLQETLVYKRDPGENAYNRMMGMSYEWLRKEKGLAGSGSYQTPRSKALYDYRQAKRFGDRGAQRKALLRLEELGVNYKDLGASIRRAHPLGSIPIKDRSTYLKTLTGKERKSLDMAIEWYRETYID